MAGTGCRPRRFDLTLVVAPGRHPGLRENQVLFRFGLLPDPGSGLSAVPDWVNLPTGPKSRSKGGE